MKRFLALASFALVVSIVSGASDEPEVIKVDVTSRMYLKGDNVVEKVKRCTVETSEGKTYEFHPYNGSPGLDLSSDKYCKIDVRRLKASYAGLWTVTTFIINDVSFEKKFVVKMTQTVTVKPANHISANVGQWARVWLDGNVADVKACALTSPFPESKTYDLINDKIEGMSRYRGCGVRMHIDKAKDGEWKISQQIGNDLVETGIFSIIVPYDDGDDMQVKNYTWNLGESARIQIKHIDMTFCQLTKPDGTLTHMMFGICLFEILAVTEFHQGIWWAAYGMAGKMELNRVMINVKTWDLNALNAMRILGPGEEINLLCRTGVRDLKFCGFIRPDKYVIHSPVGVGNDNYSYYGDGYKEKFSSAERYYGDCGLTIHKPWDADFGLWTCEMGIGNDVRGTVIEVVKKRTKRTYEIEHPQVFVKRGDRFKIRCEVNAKLDYCWLTSPNGTIYSILTDSVSSSSLKYNGKGFGMGDCGAIYDSANITENGEWTCHLGITGSAEVEEKILVHVTESYIVPVDTKVQAYENAKLSCRSFLGEDGTIQYCRWVRPNNRGINTEDASRYDTITMIDRCELTILVPEPEDIGKWTCVAMTRASKVEEWAIVELKSLDGKSRIASVISIVLGSGLLIMILTGAYFASKRFYKRRNVQDNVKSPPPYDSEDYEGPRGIQTDSDQPTVDKFYKY